MASFSSQNYIIRPGLRMRRGWLYSLHNAHTSDTLIWALSVVGAIVVGGESVTLEPAAYITGLVVWAFSIAYRAWKETRRVDQVAKDKMLTEYEVKTRQLKAELKRVVDQNHRMVDQIAQERARVEIARARLEQHELSTEGLTRDK